MVDALGAGAADGAVNTPSTVQTKYVNALAAMRAKQLLEPGNSLRGAEALARVLDDFAPARDGAGSKNAVTIDRRAADVQGEGREALVNGRDFSGATLHGCGTTRGMRLPSSWRTAAYSLSNRS